MDQFKEKFKSVEKAITAGDNFAKIIFDNLNDLRGVDMDEFDDQIQDEIKDSISRSIVDAIYEFIKE